LLLVNLPKEDIKMSLANFVEREDIMKQLRRDIGIVKFSGSISFAAVTDNDGKATIPLKFLCGKWCCIMTGFDIIKIEGWKIEEGNTKSVLVEIGGELTNFVILKEDGRGSIKQNSYFRNEGSELQINLFEGSFHRKPLPRATIYGDIAFRTEETIEA
jgi:hypothetical protein